MTLTQILQKIKTVVYTKSQIDSMGGGTSLDTTIKSKARSVNGINADANGNVNILDLVHPIGSLYWSKNSTDPSVLFGGTWKRIKDTFILACGDTYSIGSTGGEASHTLTIDEMPSHNHTASTNTTGDHSHNFTKNIFMANGSEVLYFNDRNFDGILATDNATNGQWMGPNYISESGNHSHTVTVNNTGSNKQHNNMPPYITYYCWERTA